MTGLSLGIFKAFEKIEPDLKFSAYTSRFTPLPRLQSSILDAQSKDTSQNLQKPVGRRGRFTCHNDFGLAGIQRDNLVDTVKIVGALLTTEGRLMVVSKKAAPEISTKMTAVPTVSFVGSYSALSVRRLIWSRLSQINPI